MMLTLSRSHFSLERLRPLGLFCISCWTFCLLGMLGDRNGLTEEPARINALSNITLDRLFTAKEWEVEEVPQIQWSSRSPSYYSLAKPDAESRRNLLQFDLESGEEKIVVPGKALVHPENQRPFKIDSFEFSSDESKLLIYTDSQRVWRRNTRGDYWLLDVAKMTLKKLGGDGQPSTMMFAKFSPDGSKIAFVRQRNLYVQYLDGGKIVPLTSDQPPTSINGTSDWVNEEELNLRDCFRWSPDGESILFWQFDVSGVTEFHMLNNTENKYPRIISFAYPKVGETNSATRLGIVAAGGGEIRWLKFNGDPRDHYLPHAEWTPDGSRIVVQRLNRLQTENEVFLANPKTGETRPIMKESDTAWLENENPFRWLQKGKGLVWLSERSGWRHAYRIDLEGGELAPITSGAFDVIEIKGIDEVGGWLYYAASPEKPTQRYLFRTSLDGGVAERISPLNQTGWHEYDFAPDAKHSVHHYSHFSSPPIVELISLADHSVAKVLSDNQPLREKLKTLRQPVAEFLKVEIRDGVQLDGWCLKPPDWDESQKYPLLVYVYGEPHGQTVKDAWGGSRMLWHWMMAQQGCVVVSIDNRGTNVPRGRAWRKHVHLQVGPVAAEEQAEAVRRLLTRCPFLDSSRVGVWGWSGGGSMSLNAIFRYPELYRTAIAVAPVPDQLLYDTIYQERYMGLPSDNSKGYHRGSPITYAHRLRGNLLLVHGTGDDNCHYQGMERLIEELIANGKRFQVVPYPNRSHSISEGSNTVRHFWGELTRFLRDNLLDEDAPLPDPPSARRTLHGWTLHIESELLDQHGETTERAVELLEMQLDQIVRAVPASAVKELRKVPLYFHTEYPDRKPTAEFHPNAKWLRENGRDPKMARGIEFTNTRNFESEVDRMPNFVLHELAHAYHFRVLPDGFDHAAIKGAYEKAKESGKYDRVQRRLGQGRPEKNESAYALTNPMEYFAESSEAFFGINDFFPFTKQELARHDPEVYELLKVLWEVEQADGNR